MPNSNTPHLAWTDGAFGVFLLTCCQTGLSTVALTLGAATFGRDVNLAALEGMVGGLLASASFAPVTLVMVILAETCLACRGTGGEQIRLACLWIWVVICNINTGALGQLMFRGTSETFAAVYQNTAVGMTYCLTIIGLVTAFIRLDTPPRRSPRTAPPGSPHDSDDDRAPVERIFVVVEMPGGEPPMIAEVPKTIAT